MRILKRRELKLVAALSASWLLAACATNDMLHSQHEMSVDEQWQPDYIKLSDYQPPTSIPANVGKGCEFQYLAPELEKVSDPDILKSNNGELDFTLSVEYQERNIAGCNTWLRNYAYRQNNGSKTSALVGPTLKLKPGDILRFRLENRMPDCASAPDFLCAGSHQHSHSEAMDAPLSNEDAAKMNTPHNFNVTNFHTHGLWVSPSKNSDNVLLELQPGYGFDYEIRIPEDHPQGTFWYHAHVHGSTALQVSSGMAGAIIIEDGNPDKDLSQQPQIKNKVDRTFLLQQVAYDCNGVIEYYDANNAPSDVDVCKLDDGTSVSLFGTKSWQQMQRRTLINGQVVPSITVNPGEVQRWRFVHAGVRETLKLVTLKDSDDIKLHQGIIGDAEFVGSLNQVSVDGLNTGQLDRWCLDQTVKSCNIEALQPGYRADYLYKAPIEPGIYWLIDEETAAKSSLQGEAENKEALMQIVVAGQNKADTLPTSAALKSYQAHAAPTQAQIQAMNADTTNTQDMMFYLGNRSIIADITDPTCLTVSNSDIDNAQGDSEPPIFSINGLPFGQNPDRDLELGQWQRWNLCTRGLASMHPYHIHVNPFYAYRTGPDGEQQGVWRDTLAIEKTVSSGLPNPDTNYPATVVYSENRYPSSLPGISNPDTVKKMYAGAFVLHCHILDHEDQGMMQKVVLVE